jgi:hypothetical protein
MNIEFEIIKENEDGSAIAEVFLDTAAKGLLIQLGFETLLLRYIEQEKTNLDT